MALTSKEQALMKKELKELLTKKLEAKVYLDSLDYVDVYKDEIRKKGTDDEFTAQVIDKPSSLRKYLEAVGVSSSSKNDVIGKTKKASTELQQDIAILGALISLK